MKKLFLTLLPFLCLSILVMGQDSEKNKFLYNAILKNDMDKVVKLLNDGADANYVYSTNNPPTKISMLITAVNKRNLGMVKTLVEHKADVNFKDGFNIDAIIYAASTGSKAMVQYLLENGADIHSNDGEGTTVLSAAKESKNDALIKFVKEKLKE